MVSASFVFFFLAVCFFFVHQSTSQIVGWSVTKNYAPQGGLAPPNASLGASGIYTFVPDRVNYDPAGQFNITSGNYVAPYRGTYFFGAIVTLGSKPTNATLSTDAYYGDLILLKKGVLHTGHYIFARQDLVGSGLPDITVSTSFQVNLSVNDTVAVGIRTRAHTGSKPFVVYAVRFSGIILGRDNGTGSFSGKRNLNVDIDSF
eukprot:TRINITY_DN4936_c0_g2_i1.p1 TRINITY_DN4936_c0_g2~~TRINITY_DN4936_c0_g2_i1.p1  ORF type:complete len:203 (+),score=63.47 TRINITY_DN4936_c0_g2_i1:227-835(+)